MALDTLPGGILRVVNSPSSAAAAGWTLEEVLRVGAIDADGPTAFGGIRGLAVLDDGGCAALDAIPQELRIFDGDGRHRATFVWQGAMMNDGQIWKPSVALGPPRENVMRVFNAEMALVDSLAMPPDPVVDPTDPPGAFYWEAPRCEGVDRPCGG
jgi:hypothetical protein